MAAQLSDYMEQVVVHQNRDFQDGRQLLQRELEHEAQRRQGKAFSFV